MSKFIALLCAAAMTITASTVVWAEGAAPSTPSDENVQATEAPSEKATEAADATAAPSEKATEAADATAAPSEKATEAADATAAPSEKATEAADATAAPSEKADATEAPSEKTDATEAPSEKADATEAPSEKADATEAPSEAVVNPFEDCQNEWFTDAVTYAYTNGLIKGYDDVTFGPQDDVTRDQLAVILYRQNAEGDIVTEGENWAAEAEAWVTANGIMSDFIVASFDGSTALSREEIVTAIYKTYMLSNTPAEGADITGFTDAETISGYAVDAFKWAVASGVIEGNEELELNPAHNVTRAETSAILQRYLTKLTFADTTDDKDADAADKDTTDGTADDKTAETPQNNISDKDASASDEAPADDEAPEELEASEEDASLLEE